MLYETTSYSITNEFNKKSTIALHKLTADVLQIHIPDVHTWIQSTYDLVLAKMPSKSRLHRGNMIRLLANQEAQNYPEYLALIDTYL